MSGRLPDIDAPRTFTEWVQWRKLNERSLYLAAMTDKIAAKALVAGRLGAEWVLPTLWQGKEAPPNDYKVYVFGGSAEVVQVHTGQMSDHRWVQYDPRWNRLSNGEDCPPPVGLDAMIVAAEALGQGHDFVRVDFYDIPGQPLFGEYCLYPGSGLDPFDPVGLDDMLGDKWRAARAALGRD